MESAKQPQTTRSEVEEDLKYWAAKKAHFEKTKNKKGIAVTNLLLDKYLDILNKIPKGL